MNRSQLLMATALSASAVFLVPGMAVAQSTDWSGFYMTLGIGAVGGDLGVTTSSYGSLDSTSFTFSPTLIGAGVNFDAGQFVIGLEADISGFSQAAAGTTSGGANVSASLNNLMTARLRAGVEVDRLLLFATAGLAAGNASLATSYTDNGKGSVPSSGAESGIVTGLVGGVGAEYAASEHVSFKLDTLAYALDPFEVAAGGGNFDHTASMTPVGGVVRAGINVHIK